MQRDGFTLLEIIISMLLLSIVVFGAASFFSKIGEYFFALTLKQKAIFVLNGEMAKEYAVGVNKDDLSPPSTNEFTTFRKNEHIRYEFNGKKYVWIDQERLIIGNFTIDKEPLEKCYNDSCKIIKTTVKYPYRIDDSGKVDDETFMHKKQIELKTIVGKR